MSPEERLSDEIKTAMRARNAPRLGALRLLKSAVGYAQIEKKADALTPAEFVALVQKEARKRRDSIEQFTAGNRLELAEVEKLELAVLEEFLPQPLPAEGLEQLVRTAIADLGATSKKDMGPVIKAVQAAAAGRADGRTISGLVGKLLP